MKIHHICILLFLFFTPNAFAGTIAKVTGTKVFILFDAEDSFAEGDLFVGVNADGKKTGLILIEKVRGLKAIGALKKGKAFAGSTTEFKAVSKSASKKSKFAKKSLDDSDEGASRSKNSNRPRWGLLGGYGLASQTVTAGAESYQLKGSSLSIKGLYDLPVFESLYLRALGGAEIFSVTGTGPITSPAAQTKITYLDVDLLIKWDFFKSSGAAGYLIGGMGVFYPMSKSSSIIETETLTSFVIGEFGGGYEMNFGTYSIPIEVSYYYFPAGETVKTTVISIKTGVIF